LFEDTVPAAFAGSSVEVDVRDADEPLGAGDLATLLGGYHGVLCQLTDRLDESVLEANPHLEVISNVAVGVDNSDLPVARRLGITVTNTPDVLTETTADLTLALMLAVARRLPEADNFVRSGSWTSWKLSPSLMGVDLYGKTLGLFGLGRIGRAVARRPAGFRYATALRGDLGQHCARRARRRVGPGRGPGERADLGGRPGRLLGRAGRSSAAAGRPGTPGPRPHVGNATLDHPSAYGGYRRSGRTGSPGRAPAHPVPA
jgi:hypothetical protein